MTSPGGVVALLFTDLVRSTELLARLGDDAADELRRRHFAGLRQAVAASGGEEIKSLGDGLMVSFTSPVAALSCAVAMQGSVEGSGLDRDKVSGGGLPRMSISRDIPLNDRFVVEMSPEEYEALPPNNRHEYVDGCLIVNPRGTFDHQLMLRNVTTALQGALPSGYVAINEWAWKPGADEWAPDVMVVELTERTVRYTGTPDLIVEVLSTNRADDLVRKLYRYAAAGLPRYWLADPLEPSVRAYVLRDGIFELVNEASGDDEGSFDLGVATVQLRPSDLLRLDYP